MIRWQKPEQAARETEKLHRFVGDWPKSDGSFNTFLDWQASNQPDPFWVDTEAMELGGQFLELDRLDRPKRLELVWDPVGRCPMLRVEQDAFRERQILFRRMPREFGPAQHEGPVGEPSLASPWTLAIEVRDFDVRNPIDESTGLLNTGVNRRIRRKIDSRALRIRLVRRIYERLRQEGVVGRPAEIRRREFYWALRALAGEDSRWKGFTGLLRNYQLPGLLREAFEADPIDEITPQLCLPLFENYLAGNGNESTLDLEPIRQGLWPTSRSRKGVIEDLRLWILLQETRATMERGWSVNVSMESLVGDQTSGGGVDVEFQIPEPVPCRRGDTLLVESGLERLVGKLLVTAVGETELRGWLHIQTDGPLQGGLTLVPIRSSYSRISDALRRIESAIQDGREASLTPALRAALGIGPMDVVLRDWGDLRSRLRSNAIGKDPSQVQALRWALHPESPLVLIQGPPGTGKTTLIEEICRQAVADGLKVAVTGPSHPAVDNVLRRLVDMPLLRVAACRDNIANELDEHWSGHERAQQKFAREARKRKGFIVGGTHLGLMNNPLVSTMRRNGLRFDLILIDEAGMSRPEEVALSLNLANRGLLIGDQEQLPPFPLTQEELSDLEARIARPLLYRDRVLLNSSGLEVLIEERGFPSVLLSRNYRSHNPRLLELSSQLFYDSRIRLAPCREFFSLPFLERRKKYGPESLRFFETSNLPLDTRSERVEWQRGAPGYCSYIEAAILLSEFRKLLRRYPLAELCLISPYRLQVDLLRHLVRVAVAEGYLDLADDEELGRFLRENVTTIDSFQGRECDVLLVSYVRSNQEQASGFVGDPRRINVTHTRARREMVITGDLSTLSNAPSRADLLALRSAYVFRQMAEIVRRRGLLLPLTSELPFRKELDLARKRAAGRELQSTG